MKGRQYFLVFFLAIAGSALITLFLDSGTRDWNAYKAESIAAHFAVPVSDDVWAIQYIVRSQLPIPYTRVLLYSTDTSSGTFLDRFEDQLYPMGSTGHGLSFYRDPTLIEALRESQLSSRLFAPERIQGQIITVYPNGGTSEQIYDVAEGGIPFLCASSVVTTSYGNSDTSFYKVNGDEASPWLVMRDEISDVPFCASDGKIYLRSEGQSYVVESNTVRSLNKIRLTGGFTLDGSWIGVPRAEACTYFSQARNYASSISTHESDSPCRANAYFARDWSVIGDEEKLSLSYQGDTKTISGKLIGVNDWGFAVADNDQVYLYWRAEDSWQTRIVANADWIDQIPLKSLPEAQ